MKPLRAFPFPLNVGTDICQISRIYTILRGPRRARFVNRILAPEELAQRDPRLAFLAGVGTTKSSSQTSAREAAKHDAEVALRETPLWKSAAFLAGRCACPPSSLFTCLSILRSRLGRSWGPRLGRRRQRGDRHWYRTHTD